MIYAVTFNEMHGKRSLKIEASYDDWAIGLFSARDFARCEKANQIIQEFVAKKTGTSPRTHEFAEALNCFSKREIEKLFPRIEVSKNAHYFVLGNEYRQDRLQIEEGANCLVKDTHWYLLKGIRYGGEKYCDTEKKYVYFADKIAKIRPDKIKKLNLLDF